MKITAFLGFSVLLLAICGSVFCAYHGKESAAITLGSTAIIAICGAMVKLIWGKNQVFTPIAEQFIRELKHFMP